MLEYRKSNNDLELRKDTILIGRRAWFTWRAGNG
jgi:hypothetical protein